MKRTINKTSMDLTLSSEIIKQLNDKECMKLKDQNQAKMHF